MKKKIFSIFLSALMLIGMAACGGDAPAADSPTEAAAGGEQSSGKGGLTIGYACKDVNDTFQTYLIEAAQEYADANQITLNVVDAQNDVVKQQDQVKDFITQGVDAILVLIIDTSSAAPLTAAAQEAGIPLIYVNTNPYPDGNVPEGIYYVGSIEKEAGELQAEYLGKLLDGKGNACILQGTLVHEGAVQRSEGVVDKLAELYPEMTVIAQQPADWQKDKAMGVMENWLTAYNGDIQAVFANNDEMALGAVNALQAIGKSDTLVMGIDGTTAALEAIKDGKLTGSIFQDAKGQAQGAMEIAAKIIAEETVEDQIKWVPFVLITSDNVDEFMN